MIQNTFKKAIEDMQGLINGETWSAPQFLVAVSGGMDSMCLAQLFLENFGPESFAIAHCNFNLRGEESDGDEALVREWARKHGVHLHVTSFDTEVYAAEYGMSIEMAARELRYSWFATLCKANGYSYVAVAHHADDNAETLVLNLVRGTGMKGLAGMKPVSDLPYSVGTADAKLIRPLLGSSRKQIEGYVHEYKVPYRNDSTNSSVDYKRNRVRHEIFPSLLKMNPSFVKAFNREMAYFEEANQIVDDWCSAAAASVVERLSEDNSEIRISVSALKSYRQWRYLLYHILEPYGFNTSVLESVEDLLDSERTVSGKYFHSSDNVLVTGRDHLMLMPAEKICVQGEDLKITAPGIYKVNGHEVMIELYPWSAGQPLKQPAGVLVFDAAKLSFPFILRSWNIGDWMNPFGMKGRKKVSDIFADLKYDASDKLSALVLEEGQSSDKSHVAALLGVRMDDRYKISSSTSMVLKISIL